MMKLIKTISSVTVAGLTRTAQSGSVACDWLNEWLLHARERQVTIDRSNLQMEIDQELMKYRRYCASLSEQEKLEINALREEMKNYKF